MKAGTGRRAGNSPVFVVDGVRTPFLTARTRGGPFSAADLAVAAGRSLLVRQPFEPETLDEVVVANVLAGTRGELARTVALRLGCGPSVHGHLVTRGIASGIQALDSGARLIAAGQADLVLVIGAEAVSRAPMILNERFAAYLRAWRDARDLPQRIRLALDFRLAYLRPFAVSELPLHLSETLLAQADEAADRFGIGRDRLHAFEAQSHRRAAAAHTTTLAREVEPLYAPDGSLYRADEGIRLDLDNCNAADRSVGCAAGADGAVCLLLASQAAVARYSLQTLGRIVAVHWAAVGAGHSAIAPLAAASRLLTRLRRAAADIDLWEVEELTAAVPLACMEAARDSDYCRHQLSKRNALGEIDVARVNVDGGALAYGLPLGAANLRQVLHLLHLLAGSARYGIAAAGTACGQGGAVLLESV